MPVVRFRTTQVSGKSILRGHDRIYQVDCLLGEKGESVVEYEVVMARSICNKGAFSDLHPAASHNEIVSRI